MLKENVDNYFKTLDMLNSYQEALKIKKEEFEKENETLLERIAETKKSLEHHRNEASIDALDEFDGVTKKRYGGIGIRETKKLVYSESDALKFAKEKDLFLQLDKKAFEKAATGMNLDFVEIDKVLSVTFPKEKK